MKIKRLAVNHFGKLKELTLSMGDGINLITGENESGKSTLHSFFNAMFFGMERSRGRGAANDDYTRFLPWDGGTYAGVIEVEKDKKLYSISRNFQKDARPLIITNETDARDVPPTTENMRRLLCDLSPAIYRNTISIGQLSAGTGHELADELRNHIINLKTSGNVTINPANAQNKLQLQKKRLESSFSKSAKMEAEELTLRIASMEKDLDNSPALPRVSKLEYQKQALENKTQNLERQANHLSDEIAESESTLRNHMIATRDDVKSRLEDLQDYNSEAEEYLDKHSLPMRGAIRFMFAMLTVLSVCGLLFAGWFAYSFFNQKNMMWTGIMGGAALLMLIIAIVTIVLQVKGADFRYVCRRMSEMYEAEFGEYPDGIGPEQVKALEERLSGYDRLFDTIEQDRAQLGAARNQLAAAREDYANVSRSYDEARQITWQYEQKEVALRMLHERMDGLSDQLEKNAQITRELEALSLASSTIQKISDEMFESFGLFLEETSSDLIRSITGGAYTGMMIDEDFNITLEHHGLQVPINRVSSGTLDQVYLAVRLACVEFLWPDESMPLLFDDTFAMYDHDRLQKTLQWLSENYAGQIFIFTCHTREAEILEELHIPYKHITLS